MLYPLSYRGGGSVRAASESLSGPRPRASNASTIDLAPGTKNRSRKRFEDNRPHAAWKNPRASYQPAAISVAACSIALRR